jgi:uncharacterized protein YdiU (UPF0061 family)
VASASNIEPLRAAFYRDGEPSEAHRARLVGWLGQYERRLEVEAMPRDERVARMNRANPKYVLRNYQAQLAIDAATEGDVSLIERLLRVLAAPYDEQPEHEDLAQRRPEWARNRAGCSALSCSS